MYHIMKTYHIMKMYRIKSHISHNENINYLMKHKLHDENMYRKV